LEVVVILELDLPTGRCLCHIRVGDQELGLGQEVDDVAQHEHTTGKRDDHVGRARVIDRSALVQVQPQSNASNAVLVHDCVRVALDLQDQPGNRRHCQQTLLQDLWHEL